MSGLGWYCLGLLTPVIVFGVAVAAVPVLRWFEERTEPVLEERAPRPAPLADASTDRIALPSALAVEPPTAPAARVLIDVATEGLEWPLTVDREFDLPYGGTRRFTFREEQR